ncbi:MAG: hypothetical protein [Caudoviricetes sp.]|nr:MAG: hypothetical protein [Caudoviricetes sp.]
MILISAGHSDKDSGAIVNRLKENELALDLRDRLSAELKDIPHITDGSEGQNSSLNEAIKLLHKCAFGIEIHFNSSSNKGVKGTEVFGLSKHKVKGERLSSIVAHSLNTNNRGFKTEKESNRKKLGFVRAGGLILEVEFLTNEEAMQNYFKYKDALIKNLYFYLKGLKNEQ